MRDRLWELQGVAGKSVDTPKYEGNEDERELVQNTIGFEGEDKMVNIFKEARSMRKEITLLRLDVKRLSKQNIRFLTSVRRISSIKRESTTLSRSIKVRGEAVYVRLEQLGQTSKELEEEHGTYSALVRMGHSQYVSLIDDFHIAMSEYNDSEMAQRENCKTRIQRQAEIMGKEVTTDQIEEMIETGKWNVFSDNLLTDGRTARSALTEIENRHKELLELERRIQDIHSLFFQMSLLVEEQGSMVDNIEVHVSATQDFVAKATIHIKKAVKYNKRNPCRRLCCCCFPCCNK
ncbi:syntaxin-11a [Aplochiton taeniatus]